MAHTPLHTFTFVSAGSRAGLLQRTAALLAKSNDALPYAVVASALLALVWPQVFSWFTPKMYAPALGFLMFAVGVNLNLSAFVEPLLVGQVCQWVIKPLIATLVALSFRPLLRMPPAVGTGLILVGCVSGAQLSNYATFLAHPEQAPLSIVLTALSTACGVVLTPLLALLLLGTRIPIDAVGMATSIAQIVLVPVTAGLACNRFVPGLVRQARPVLASASLVDTCACVGASLASNAAAARSPLGLKVLLPVLVLHGTAFVAGFQLASRTLKPSVPLARCLCLVTGMQSSLLALLLASKFFAEPLVRLPCGISVIVMTLGGFGLVLWWKGRPPALEVPQVPAAPVAAAP
ncbi:hypothetical protein WJX73_005772 [Symbiochloris irregularis]|uniref:Uncharacterized protein n=1 Tax=Symbiochloris irregularis TaxID=706552 RepID=A0AAW1NSL4_9CHLO